MAEAGRLNPPHQRLRRAALVLSACAVLFSLGFGFMIRRSWALRGEQDTALLWATGALSLLLVALLLRMVAAICELMWLERTWTNIPEETRKVGPIENVSSVMLIGISFVPGVAWLWKLGLVAGVVEGFEKIRAQTPFRAIIPKRLGMAAVIIGWIPGLNVYIAPFLWEMFARKIDQACFEIGVR